jgi:hypothetical protein
VRSWSDLYNNRIPSVNQEYTLKQNKIGIFIVLIGVESLRGSLGYMGGLIILLGAVMIGIGIFLVKEKK